MGQYIITIVPVVDDGFSGPVSQTMVRVDLDGDTPTVKELTMRAPDGAGLVTGRLPYIDVDMLVRAFVPADGAARPVPEVAAADERARRPKPSGRAPAAKHGRAAPAATRRVTPKNSHLQAGRAYRKAPDLDELAAVYLETGTIGGVAEHYDVPVHTAQGWITRMRKKNSSVTG